jgi:DNA-binding transcriptional MocR family regulator
VSSLDQLAVAELLRSQAFDRHLRRRRAAYRRRRDEFAAFAEPMADVTRFWRPSVGM